MSPNTFQYIFSPIDLGTTTVRNRIVSTAHGTGYCRDGLPSDREVAYHEARAKGGIGLIITGVAAVHPTTGMYVAQVRNIDDRIIPAYWKLQNAVHRYGAKIMAQLGHMGRRGKTHDMVDAQFPLYGPSPIADGILREPPAEMELDLIEEIIEAFGKAALRAREGGLDGVEIHGAHSNLVAQFMSPYSNQRTDSYGGTREKRLQFSIRVIQAIRKYVGQDFTVGMRISGDEFVDGGLTLDEVKQNVKDLEALGLLDFLDISAGNDSDMHSMFMHYSSIYVPPGNLTYLAASIKQIVKIPIITVGRINDPIFAERILADGMADLVGMTRAALCDPDFPNKAKAGLLEDIRHCMACNQGCFKNRHAGKPITCIQNPTAGKEREYGEVAKVTTRHKVVVVGGGPAGMETARVAAEKGHKVILFEKNSELGGQVNIAARAPGREEFGEVARYLRRQIEKLKIEVHLGFEAKDEDILFLEPESTIIATGARPLVPEIKGIEGDQIISAWDVLQGGEIDGQKFAVIDGGDLENQVAIGAAEKLANLGKQVEIITILTHVGKDLDLPTLVPTYQRLFEKKIKLTPHMGMKTINEHRVVLYNVYTWEEDYRDGIDKIVLALGRKANDRLYWALKGKVKKTYRIGDCLAPRSVMSAIREGTKLGRII